MGFFDRVFGKKHLELSEVVEMVDSEIFIHAVTYVRGLIQEDAAPELGSNPDEFNRAAWNITLELMVFSLHLTDLIAFSAVGAQKRARFMHTLLEGVSSNLARVIVAGREPRDRRSFIDGFLALYQARSQVYARLRFDTNTILADDSLSTFLEAAKEPAEACFPHAVMKGTMLLSIGFGVCWREAGKRGLASRLTGARGL